MFVIIIWILVIYLIVLKVKAQDSKSASSKRTSSRSINSNNYIPPKYSNTKKSSYYRDDKIDSYRRMNADHALHDGDKSVEEDLVNTIGYVKCPNCGASVSKKSDTCFMCDKPLK